jgi:uncharacterized protein
VIAEPETGALRRHLGTDAVVATSRLALVEVPRATELASPRTGATRTAEQMLSTCLLVDITDAVLRRAARLASRALRTLDAIHLASALRIEPDELIAYDRRLLDAAAEHGLAVASP